MKKCFLLTLKIGIFHSFQRVAKKKSPYHYIADNVPSTYVSSCMILGMTIVRNWHPNIPDSRRHLFCWVNNDSSLLGELKLHSYLERKLGILYLVGPEKGHELHEYGTHTAVLEQSWLQIKPCACLPVLLEEFIFTLARGDRQRF